jgi:hypothetical protein
MQRAERCRSTEQRVDAFETSQLRTGDLSAQPFAERHAMNLGKTTGVERRRNDHLPEIRKKHLYGMFGRSNCSPSSKFSDEPALI